MEGSRSNAVETIPFPKLSPPTNPTDPANPTDSANPTDPANPTDSENPTDSANPTDSENQTDSANPTNPESLDTVSDLPDLQPQQRDRTSSASSLKSLFSISTYDPSEDPYVRHLNLPVILTSAVVNIVLGGGIGGLEIAAIIFAKIHGHEGMFANLAPGAWFGVLFIAVATLGLTVRSRFLSRQPVPYPVLAVYLGLNLLACVVSLAMIAYIACVMIYDRMTYRLCFGDRCLFDLRVSPSASAASTHHDPGMELPACDYCNDAGIHDVFIIILFTMIVAYLFVFIFAFTTVKVTVRWTEFHRNYLQPEVKRLLRSVRRKFVFTSGRRRPQLEQSVYRI
ncbi:hypothetical protein BV898_04903 [Hypsibius exemplaris]|uniref:Uncharacterized protein n=1 Tax=Hypsibius exemplaris TaxID=2072580 RepID=A0A1W0X127_HYPEX|nr:hypothetical protein BV898_04903 [Hypsibius exemplaris]